MTTRTERRVGSRRTRIEPKVIIAAVLALLLAAALIGGAVLVLGGAKKSTKAVSVVIPSGVGSAEIAKILAAQEVISSEPAFLLRARLGGSSGQFKAGTYDFLQHMSDSEVIAILVKGPQIKALKVTVREGLTLLQTAQVISSGLDLDEQAFITYAQKAAPELAEKYPVVKGAYADSLEGFLFPDTYAFREDVTIEQVADRMVGRFQEVWNGLDKPEERLKQYSISELVTIASLAEREARILEERPLVVSVIDNRISDKMRLQLCSSVQFLLPGEEERTKIRLTAEDTAIESPYNTYINTGLPPGPIANPGANALEAAFHPANTEYRYFVLTGKDGSQTFTKTYAEFQKAKSKSKAVFGE